MEEAMRRTVALTLALGLIAMAAVATGQQQPLPGAPQPGVPLPPQGPTIANRQQALPQLPPPIQLTPQEQAELDQALKAWESSSARIKNFSCTFERRDFDPVFSPDKPRIDKGQIKFEAPDKGMFMIEAADQGKTPAAGQRRAERWICDGKSIFQFDYVTKQLIDHQLPPQLQGQAIANGPLPFLFGSSAEHLKQRYFLKVVTPSDVQGKQVWLTGFPRFQADAANFSQADIVLSARDMQPIGLRQFPPGKPGGVTRTEYVFDNVVTNDLLWIVKPNPFLASKPDGWRMIVEPAPTAQVRRDQVRNGSAVPR
jgi:TIGR03009 family protein